MTSTPPRSYALPMTIIDSIPQQEAVKAYADFKNSHKHSNITIIIMTFAIVSVIFDQITTIMEGQAFDPYTVATVLLLLTPIMFIHKHNKNKIKNFYTNNPQYKFNKNNKPEPVKTYEVTKKIPSNTTLLVADETELSAKEILNIIKYSIENADPYADLAKAALDGIMHICNNVPEYREVTNEQETAAINDILTQFFMLSSQRFTAERDAHEETAALLDKQYVAESTILNMRTLAES